MKKENKKCYVVTYAEADNVFYDLSYEVFETEDDAVKGMEEFMNNKFQEYEYSEDEIEEIKGNSSWDYCEDGEGEWYVRIDTANFIPAKKNAQEDTKTYLPTVDEVISWISDHKELYESFKLKFGYEYNESTGEEINKPDTLDDIVGWLSNYETAFADFCHYFGLNKKLNIRRI